MKRLLILGSVEDFTCLTKQAVDRGIYTVVVDAAHYGEAKKIACKAYDVAIDDRDGINSIIRFEKIDHVLTSFSDNLYEYSVNYSVDNGLPTNIAYDKVRYLRDKILMKKMFAELGIPTARAQKIDIDNCSAESLELQYPLILKPFDGWGSKGMYVVNSFDEIKSAMYISASYSTTPTTAMVEERNIGKEINAMTWVKDGTVTFVELGDRETSGGSSKNLPYPSREIFPAVYYDEIVDTIRNYVLKVSEYVGMTEGPISIQLFYDHASKKLSVGEVAGRFFGLGQGVTPLINGVDINTLLLNMVYDPEKNWGELKHYEKGNDHCSFDLHITPLAGVVRDLGNIGDFVNNPHVIESTIYAYPGVSTKLIPYIIRLYCRFETREEADAFTDDVYGNIFVPGLDGQNLCRSFERPVYD